MPEVSLIVSTYNWPEALRLCLMSISAQDKYPDEVIIADDGSGQETRQLIEQMQQSFPVPLKHVYQDDNGFRKTIILNKAVKAAAGSYIVQIDGDVILNRHFIKDHLQIAEPSVFVRGTRAHIAAAIHPGVFSRSEIRFSWWSGGIINRFNALRIPLLSFLFEKKIKNSERVRGSNLAYWKSDFIQVNGYNNELTGWGHEDEELAARFINNNILKKVTKFRAIQFHLIHRTASWDQEQRHTTEVQNTLANRVKICLNGYEKF